MNKIYFKLKQEMAIIGYVIGYVFSPLLFVISIKNKSYFICFIIILIVFILTYNLIIFEKNKEDVVMLWKPQPIIKDTLKQLEPEIYKEYVLLEQKFKEKKLGIYCDSLEDNWAAELCHAYYGDASSLAQMCRDKGKPVMLADVTILDLIPM